MHVYPGSEFFPSWIPDSHQRIYYFILIQKIVSKLSEIWSGFFIPDLNPGFWFFTHPGSRIQGSTGTGYATQQKILINIVSHQWCALFLSTTAQLYATHRKYGNRRKRHSSSTLEWGHSCMAWGYCVPQAAQAEWCLSGHTPPPPP